MTASGPWPGISTPVGTEVPAETEVLVVGGGPVGLAAAIHARAAGYDVVVLERRSPPLDKACGEGLLPGAWAAVRALGVEPAGMTLAGISYRSGRGHADHPFRSGPGRGVRRTALRAALAARAVEAGAIIGRATVGPVRAEAGGIVAGGVRARWLLACDGLHSTVRRAAGLEARARRGTPRFGLRRHFAVRPWTNFVEVYWGRRVEAYVTPVGPRLVGVAILGPRGLDIAAALAELPELAERLAGADPASRILGAGPLRLGSTRRATGRIRLVGDASGYVDALTGEGLRVGLAQAEAAVRFLADPAEYERAWARATRDYRVLTGALVAWASSPARWAIVPAARLSPALFGAIVDRLAR